MLYEQWEPGVMTREDRDKDRRVYFGSFFRDLSHGLPQCYGGHLKCEDCENEAVHDKCRVKEWVTKPCCGSYTDKVTGQTMQ